MGMHCFLTGILSFWNIDVHRLVPSSQLFFTPFSVLPCMAVKVESK